MRRQRINAHQAGMMTDILNIITPSLLLLSIKKTKCIIKSLTRKINTFFKLLTITFLFSICIVIILFYRLVDTQ